MDAIERQEVGVPTYDDFDVLKETYLELAKQPDSKTKIVNDGLGLYVKIERLYADLDFLAWPLLTICFSGLLRARPGGNKLLIRYRELAHNPTTENSSVNHDYILETEGKELIQFGQSILACPQIPESRQEHATDNQMNQADEGRRILRLATGHGLEISSGYCGILFDRMAEFMS